MRRRLTVAILAVVVGTLVLTLAGSVVLERRATVASAEDELRSEASALGQLLADRTAVTTDERIITLLRRVGSYDYLAPVGLSPAGRFSYLPAPLTASDIDVASLQAGSTVVGSVGQEAFAAQPLALTARQRAALASLPAGDQAVLVVTRRARDPVNGVWYFLLVAGVVLAVGAAVAAVLARRLSAPIRGAAVATRRIAEGDLGATVPVGDGDPPELRELAEAVNAMGTGLARAQGQQRQFLLSVSHDLRTPLTSIRGYAEALAEGAADDVPGALAVIGGEARRLERLVQDLLDLARLDARQFSLDMQRLDAAAVVASVVDAMRPEAAALGVALRFEARGGAGPWVEADPDRLAQVIGNLVENGCRFAGGTVEVALAEQERWCRISVGDDGPGIPAGDLGHVFERHFTSARQPGRRVGTGLGLAIVAELASAMGGTVVAHSPLTPAGGTSMVLWLPSRPAPAPG